MTLTIGSLFSGYLGLDLGVPIPFGDSDLYAEAVDGALDAAAERDALAAENARLREGVR